VKLYEIYETLNSVYFIMEYLKGGELLKKNEPYGFYNENDAVAPLRSILESLDHMHSSGVIHRDIKPENILLTAKDGDGSDIKIIDFGFALQKENMHECKIKQCGTPGYMAPEMFSKGDEIDYDERCDIFSAGIIFYKM